MNTTRSPLFLLTALAVIGFAGCATTSQRPTSDLNTKADFSKYRTYAWVLEPAEDTDFVVLSNASENYKLIQSAIEAEMARKGYSKASRQTADMELGFLIALQDMVSNTVIDRYFGQSKFWLEAEKNKHLHPDNWKRIKGVERGGLIVDAEDASTGQPLWRGVKITPITSRDSARIRENTIRQIVRDAMASLPRAGG